MSNTIAPPITEPKRTLAIMNIVAFVVMIGVNMLSILLPLNNKSQEQLSAQYPNLFTPAGFTFSVWSVIYVFYLGFTIYATTILLKRQHPLKDKIALASPYFIGICLCNAAWLFAWHYQYVLLSVCIIFLYLLLLIVVHQVLHLALPWQPLPQKLWLDIPFSLNLGWICVATIANFTAWCVQNRWGYDTFSEATWASIMIAVGSMLALLYVLRARNYAFGLVVVWSLFGILSKRQSDGGEGAETVITASWIGMGLIFAAIVWKVVGRQQQQPPHPPLFSQP